MKNSRSNPVKFELIGGLGNQIFQYVASQYFQDATKKPVEIDCTYCGPIFQSHGSSILDLRFSQMPKMSIISPKNTRVKFIEERISSRNSLINYARNKFQNRYVSKTDGFDDNLQEVKKGKVRGYFQTYVYLSNLQQTPLKAELNQESHWVDEVTSQIDSSAVAIHLRRGDYGKLSQSFGLLNYDYYNKALNKLSSLTSVSKIYIFSDDVEMAEQLAFKLGKNTEVVRPPEGEPDASTLIVMSKFEQIVIANSSFSWWAAQLNLKKKVVFPDPWFRDFKIPEKLIPDDWISCTSEWIESPRNQG